MNVEHEKESQTQKCPIGVFHAPAFVADFPPIALEFHHRTHASEIWAQLTKDFLTKSGTERFRENIKSFEST